MTFLFNEWLAFMSKMNLTTKSLHILLCYVLMKPFSITPLQNIVQEI